MNLYEQTNSAVQACTWDREAETEAPVVNAAERSRQTVHQYYESGEGRADTDTFAVLLAIRDRPGVEMRELTIERGALAEEYGRLKAGKRSHIRRELVNSVAKAIRHQLIRTVGKGYEITDRGRQYLLGGMISRIAMHKSMGGLYTLRSLCALCAEDELPGLIEEASEIQETRTEMVGAHLARAISNWYSGTGATQAH